MLGWSRSRGTPRCGAGGGAGRGAREEDQLELADLDLVAAGQGRGIDPLAVHEGAIEAAAVLQGEGAVLAPDLGVPAGHGDVVQEDVARWVAPARHDVLVEEELGPGVRPPPDHD